MIAIFTNTGEYRFDSLDDAVAFLEKLESKSQRSISAAVFKEDGITTETVLTSSYPLLVYDFLLWLNQKQLKLRKE